MLDKRYLAQLIGQDSAVSLLSRFLASQELNRSLLFHGPRSVGKSTAARLFAADLLVDARPIRGLHPDFTVLREEDTGTIDKVKEWRAVAYKASFEQGRVVMVLEGVEKLSEEAANSLLKLLEEPPPLVTIILLAASLAGVLDTIQSRCMKVRFYPLSFESCVKVLSKKGKSDSVVERIVFSGSLAEAVFSDDFQSRKQAVLDMRRKVAAIGAMPLADLLVMADSVDPRLLAEYVLAVDSRPKAMAAAMQCLDMCAAFVKPASACLHMLISLRGLA